MRKIFISGLLALLLGMSKTVPVHRLQKALKGIDGSPQDVQYVDDKGNPINLSNLGSYIPVGEEIIPEGEEVLPVGEEVIPGGSGNGEDLGNQGGKIDDKNNDDDCDWCQAKGPKKKHEEEESVENVEIPSGGSGNEETSTEENIETPVPSQEESSTCGTGDCGVCATCGGHIGLEEENVEVPVGPGSGNEEAASAPKESKCETCGNGENPGAVIVISVGDCADGNCGGCAGGGCLTQEKPNQEENVEIDVPGSGVVETPVPSIPSNGDDGCDWCSGDLKKEEGSNTRDAGCNDTGCWSN